MRAENAYQRLMGATILRTDAGDLAGAAKALRAAREIRLAGPELQLASGAAQQVARVLGSDDRRVLDRWYYLAREPFPAPAHVQQIPPTRGGIESSPDASYQQRIERELARLARDLAPAPNVDRRTKAALLGQDGAIYKVANLIQRQPTWETPFHGRRPVLDGPDRYLEGVQVPATARGHYRDAAARYLEWDLRPALLELGRAADRIRPGQGEVARSLADQARTLSAQHDRPGETPPAIETTLQSWNRWGQRTKDTAPPMIGGAAIGLLIALVALAALSGGRNRK